MHGAAACLEAELDPSVRAAPREWNVPPIHEDRRQSMGEGGRGAHEDRCLSRRRNAGWRPVSQPGVLGEIGGGTGVILQQMLFGPHVPVHVCPSVLIPHTRSGSDPRRSVGRSATPATIAAASAVTPSLFRIRHLFQE